MLAHFSLQVNQPQFAPGMVVNNEAPYNYMIPAILSCLCCCWPLGLAANIYINIYIYKRLKKLPTYEPTGCRIGNKCYRYCANKHK
jgi:hypothetical protein